MCLDRTLCLLQQKFSKVLTISLSSNPIVSEAATSAALVSTYVTLCLAGDTSVSKLFLIRFSTFEGSLFLLSVAFLGLSVFPFGIRKADLVVSNTDSKVAEKF